MLRYHGNEWAKAGFYWSPSRWEIVTVPKGGGHLKGEEKVSYFRLPLLLVMVLGPLIGALYVGFLPLIGFALVIGFAAKKCFPMVEKVWEKLLAMVNRRVEE